VLHCGCEGQARGGDKRDSPSEVQKGGGCVGRAMGNAGCANDARACAPGELGRRNGTPFFFLMGWGAKRLFFCFKFAAKKSHHATHRC
jgi:hypothetical protein